MNNRRIWPELVNSSLDWSPVSTSPNDYLTAPRKSQRITGPSWEQRNAVLVGSKPCLARYKRQPLKQSNLGFCSERTSDILVVTGGIAAITGALIAALGVYPRNQVGIIKHRRRY